MFVCVFTPDSALSLAASKEAEASKMGPNRYGRVRVRFASKANMSRPGTVLLDVCVHVCVCVCVPRFAVL